MTARLSLLVVVTLLVCAVVLGGVAGFWVLHTPAGTRWSIQQIDRFAGDRIQIEAPAGTWSSEITLGRLRYQDGETEAVLTAMSFRVILSRLPAKELFLEHLDIERLDLTLPVTAPAEPAAGGPSVAAPLDLVLRRGRIGQLVIGGETSREVTELEASGVWSGRRISIARLSARAFGITAEAGGAVVLSEPIALAASLAWTMTTAEGGEWQGQAEVEGDLRELRFSHELLTPFTIATAGTLALEPKPRVALTSRSETLSYTVGEQTVSVRDGSLTVSGWLDAYDFSWRGRLTTGDFPAVMTSAEGAGDLSGMRLASAQLDGAGGRLNARGDLSWSPDLAGQLAVMFTDLNPELLLPGWPGSLSGEFAASGRRAAAGFSFAADNIRIGGQLRDQPVLLQGNLGGTEGQLRFRDVRLVSGANRVQLDGVYGDRFELSYEANLKDLSLLGPEWSGTLIASGAAAGTLAAPTLEIEASGQNLLGPGYGVANLELSGRVAPRPARSTLSLSATEIAFGERRADRVAVEASGALEDHQILVTAFAGADSLALGLRGGWLETRWQGQMVQSELDSPQVGRWRQSEPGDLRLAQNELELGQLCWSEDAARLCLQGSVAPSRLALAASVADVSLAPLAELLPPGVALAGRLAGDATVTGTPDVPAVRFAAAVPSIDLKYTFAPEEDAVETSLRDVVLTGTVDPSELDFKLALAGVQGSDLDFSAALTDWQQPGARVNAQLRALIPDVAFLSMLYTEVTDWAGALEADLAVGGTLDAPEVAGFVRLADGRAVLRRAGIQLSDVQVEARPAGVDRLGLVASARSGDGVLNLAGGIELDAAAGWPVAGELTGERFTALRLPGVDVVISPRVSIAGAGNTIRLSGQLVAPRAIVELKELPEQAIEVSPDVTVHGRDETQPDRPAPLRFHTDLELLLGDEVRFSGFGLRTQLAGQLALTSAPQRPMEGRGVVNITSGRFQAYGQNLEIDSGTLLFSGPLDDPTLDVTAVRRVDGTTVGVRVRGTGRAPEATVFSEPAMSEADALSYLLIGRPLAQATSAEGTNVKNTAVALGLKQAMPITDQLGQAVGLDELGLDPDNVDTGAVMAGKQITPDLYVRYSYGLFNRLGAVLLRYRLNSRLSLEARSAEDQSMDVIYTRERP